MSYSDDYEIDPTTENAEDNVTEPEPPSYRYPIIDNFEESMLATRLMELIPPPPPGPIMAATDDELEMLPDFAQPFAGALRNIVKEFTPLKGVDGVKEGGSVEDGIEVLAVDVELVKHFLGIHALIAFYVARFYHLDLNAVIEQSMTRIEHEAAEDRKIQAALNDMNMTHGGSITPRSAAEDAWPDALF